MAKSSGGGGDALGFGKAAAASAKAAADVKVKEFDNRIKRKQFERDVKLKRIQADVDVTKIRQTQFTKRHKTINESIQTFRNTADEVVNSLDRSYLFLNWTTKQGKQIKLELSPLGLTHFIKSVVDPLCIAVSSQLALDDPIRKFCEYVSANNFLMWQWFERLTEAHPEVFQKTVAAGSYYMPPGDPDANTDPGSGSSGDNPVDERDPIVPDSPAPTYIPQEGMTQITESLRQAGLAPAGSPANIGAALRAAGEGLAYEAAGPQGFGKKLKGLTKKQREEMAKIIADRIAQQQVDTTPVFE